jgi:sugar phosphate isomerase/epimerase
MNGRSEAEKRTTNPTRRQIGTAILTLPLGISLATSAPNTIDSTVAGVAIGAQSYSFRDRGLDACVQAFVDCGLGYAELWHGHLEPKNADLKQWRKSAPESFFKDVRAKFDRAAVRLVACSFDFDDSFSDEEIEHVFNMVYWMGLNRMTASPKLDIVKRLDRFANKYEIYVGLHNHSTMKPNDLATPSDFAIALQNRSKYMCLNLDIGNATAAGWDPVHYFIKHRNQIIILHLKDSKLPREHQEGATVPWGQGDTDIRKILTMVRQNGSNIVASIEYQYGTAGMNSVTEVRKCFQYCKQALE